MNTDRGKHDVAYTLAQEQAAAAGIPYGSFFFKNPHLVPWNRFDNRMGALTEQESLEIETIVLKARRPSST